MNKLGPGRLEQAHDTKSTGYIPAFSHSFLTPFYDFMMKYAARESTFKPRLVEQARVEPDHRVLDLGCGTATLTILIKRIQPKADVVGLDADPEILEIAKMKVAKAGVNITVDYGTASELPYPDNSFDRVFSSMVFHHLTRESKVRSLREVFRVLRPRGELHVADLGKPHNGLMHLPGLIIGRLEEASDNVEGLLPKMFRDSGFVQVEETTRCMTVFGTVSLYKAQKPRESSGETIDVESSGSKDVSVKKNRRHKTLLMHLPRMLSRKKADKNLDRIVN